MWAEMIVAGVTRYLEMGLCVAGAFVFLVGHIEPSARGGSIMFRLLIMPGAVLLWPWIALRVLTKLARSRELQTKVQRS